jgi:prevent-host-death family protein
MTIAIAKAKALFSRCIARARRGEEIIITDRGRPVAKLSPMNTSEEGLSPHVKDMVRTGRLRPPREKWDDGFFRRPPARAKSGVLRALLNEREEERKDGVR